MRALAPGVLILALAACAPPGPRVHTQAEWRGCSGEIFAGDRAAACSAVIADPGASAERRAAALLERGKLRIENGQHGRAAADFGRALRLNPNFADALIERGVLHAERGAFDSALRDFDAALSLSPGHPRALEQRNIAMSGRTDAYAQQIAQLSAALMRNPLDAELLNNRCWIRAVAGRDLELALADCNAAVLRRADFAAALDSRGLVQLKRGAYAEALADYEAALQLEPQNGHFLYGRGLARRSLGMATEAAEDFAAAESAEPGIAEQYRTYGV